MELKHLDLIDYNYKIIIYEITKNYSKNLDSFCQIISRKPSHHLCSNCDFFLKFEISTLIPEQPQEFILCKKKHDKRFFPNGFIYIFSNWIGPSLYTIDLDPQNTPEYFIC